MISKVDIRQSENWAEYLHSLNWNSHRTSSGLNIEYIKSFLGGIVKIQRPALFDKKDLLEIETFCKGIRPLFIKMEPFFGQNLRILEEAGYVKSDVPMVPPSTIYIDLTKSEEELWTNISHGAKYSVKWAQKEGITLRFYQNPLKEKLELYFQMVQETGRRKHFYTQPYKDMLSKVEIWGKECHMVLSYDKEGNLLSGKFFLCYGDMVLYSSGGTTKLGMESKGGYEPMWKSILYFKGLGYKVMDLEGKDDERFPSVTGNWGGFSYFKESFGGEVVEFPYPYIKYISSVLKFMSKFSKLPL
jgi:lipid II:glycine glycyltransferase (peptidoglycan interpeptide bridge formation enzyme)